MAASLRDNATTTQVADIVNSRTLDPVLPAPFPAVSSLPPSPSCLSPPVPAPIILDTGCTSHFLMMSGPYINACPVAPGLAVTLPSGATITSTHTATLDLPSLPLATWQCHLFPDLTSGSLISVDQLCDHGCTARFTGCRLCRHHAL